MVQVEERKRVINYELLYGEWLKALTEKYLSPLGFSISHRKMQIHLHLQQEYMMCQG